MVGRHLANWEVSLSMIRRCYRSMALSGRGCAPQRRLPERFVPQASRVGVGGCVVTAQDGPGRVRVV